MRCRTPLPRFREDDHPVADGRQRQYFAYDYSSNRVPGDEDALPPYWRDVGTVDSYWDASMDLISVTPPLNLYNPKWVIKSRSPQLPPAKFVFADAASNRIGIATDSIVSNGCIISGGTIHRSILFPRVRVNSFSHIEECVLMDGVEVGRHARLRRVIADKGLRIPPRVEIGFDPEEDRRRFHVSEGASWSCQRAPRYRSQPGGSLYPLDPDPSIQIIFGPQTSGPNILWMTSIGRSWISCSGTARSPRRESQRAWD